MALARSVFGVDILNCVVFNGRIGDSIGSSSGDPLHGTLRDEKPIENNDFFVEEDNEVNVVNDVNHVDSDK